MTKRKLYQFVAISVIVGTVWVLYNVVRPFGTGTPDLCIFKNITGLPCPACGSTHAVLKLLQLDWLGAFLYNPFGYVLALGMLIIPAWLAYDLCINGSTFFRFYLRFESFVRTRWVACTLVAIVAANWIWNICKYTA
jgi:hypothetical protein